MTARSQTGLADFLGRVAPVVTSVSSSATQEGKCLPTLQSSTVRGDGEGVQNPTCDLSCHQSSPGGLSWVHAACT